MSLIAGRAVRLWAATELRRRWLALVLLGVLSGVAAGLAMAAYDGAQRSSTAYERMRQQFGGADAIVFPSQVDINDFDPSILGRLPEVAAWGGFSLNNSSVDELPDGAAPLITIGDDWFTRLEGAKVLAGRLPDPSRDDEAVVTSTAAAQVPSAGIGLTLTWRNLSKEEASKYGFQMPPDFDWRTAHGTVTRLTVVGIVRLPLESVAAFASDGLLLTGPGWAAAHLASTPVNFTNALVRLRHGAADVPGLRADVARLTGRSDIPVKDLSTDIKRVQRSLDLEHTALLMFAAAIAITAFVLCGQAVIRATASGGEAVPILRGMGLTTAGLLAGLVAPMIVTVAAAVIVAAGVSIVASRWFPIGLARKVDPITGIHVVAGRETIGLLVTAVGLVLLVVGTAVLTLRQLRAARPRRTWLLGAATRVGVPLSPAVGASLALDATPERDGRSRFALVAAIAGVVAVFATLTLLGGINGIVGHPERTGAQWDIVVSGTGPMSDDDVKQFVAGDSDVADVVVAARVPTQVGGYDAPVYSLRPLKGSLQFTVVHGRAPAADDEIALGPATIRLLHARIGDEVAVGSKNTTMRVVGVALLSQQPHSSFDEGGWTTPTALDGIAGPTQDNALYEEGFVKVADGVDVYEAMSRLPPTWELSQPSSSPDLANLLQVRHLPSYLAVFIALLALGAVSHTLFTSARQRARELAVLRALGVTSRGAAACVSWQAVVTGAVALAVGIPLGVIVGRRLWRAITDQLSFVYVQPFASGVVLTTAVIGCLAGCAVLAIIPARRAGRRHIAETLREE